MITCGDVTICPFPGSTEEAQSDAECAESVRQASAELPGSFGGSGGALGSLEPPGGSFKTRLVVVLLGTLLSRRKVRRVLFYERGSAPVALYSAG